MIINFCSYLCITDISLLGAGGASESLFIKGFSESSISARNVSIFQGVSRQS